VAQEQETKGLCTGKRIWMEMG